MYPQRYVRDGFPGCLKGQVYISENMKKISLPPDPVIEVYAPHHPRDGTIFALYWYGMKRSKN
jgi:hypothetical protein